MTSSTSMAESDPANDFAGSPVPLTARRGFPSLFFLWINFQLSTVMLFFGGVTLSRLALPVALFVVLVSTLLIASVSFATGYLGAKTGLSTALLCEHLFGVRGGQLQQVFQGAIELGWFVVIVGLTGDAATALLHFTDWYAHALVTGVVGALYIASVSFGFRGLRVLGIVAAPLVLVLLCILCIRHFASTSGPLWHPVAKDLNLFQSISIATGTFITGAALSADLSRFAKTPRSGGGSGALGFALTIPLQLLLGAVVAMTNSGTPDFLKAVTSSGLGLLALTFLVLANCIGDATLYLAVIPLARLTGVSRLKLVLVLGFVGTVLAAVGISNLIIGWLEALSILLPPLAGPMIWLLIPIIRTGSLPPVRLGARRPLWAWLAGALAGGAMEFAGIGLAPVVGITVSLVLTAVLAEK